MGLLKPQPLKRPQLLGYPAERLQFHESDSFYKACPGKGGDIPIAHGKRRISKGVIL
jgi:hypothetical protein